MDPADKEAVSGDAAAQELREREESAFGGGGEASAAAEECPATAGDDDGEGDDSASGDAATYDRMMQLLYGGRPRVAPSEESGDKGSHRFWGTQPVLDISASPAIQWPRVVCLSFQFRMIFIWFVSSF